MFDCSFGDFPSFMVVEFLLLLRLELDVACKSRSVRIGTALAMFSWLGINHF